VSDWKPDGIAPGEFGNLDTALVAMREIYAASVKAGFTEWKGIRLIAAIMCSNNGAQGPQK